MRRICVFCGASRGRAAAYAASAWAFGATAATRGLGVVYGGGKVGLMGAVADGALAAGGEVVGVIPQALVKRELAHDGLTELHVVGSLHEDYWRPLVAFARHATEEGFVREADLGSIAVAGDAEGLLDQLARLEHAERRRAKWTSPPAP